MKQREVWNAIAEPWNKYRQRKEKELKNFLKGKKGVILDLGCGSGRNFQKGKKFIGIDFSINMIKLAKKAAKEKKSYVELCVADVSLMPFKKSSFDSAIYYATLHCLQKKEREKSLKELSRVLKPKGTAIITVWNKDQPRFTKKEDYIPWKHSGKTYMRYYYLYSKGELKKELKKMGFKIENISGSENKVFNLFPRNIVATVQKP